MNQFSRFTHDPHELRCYTLDMLILGIVVSLLAYYFALKWGERLLENNDIELPRFTRWLVLNTFAFIIANIAALPFPSII
ncbi:hypothetical protein [Methylophilus sp. OH31]|uniref:hypothetical protein n=1 Tax=Methylophilus sp. OH31 TaxID=1387312 RepID=UPI0004672642|nr:hypothetical protein [Methylophilus sp. OH31]